MFPVTCILQTRHFSAIHTYNNQILKFRFVRRKESTKKHQLADSDLTVFISVTTK